MKEEIEFEKYLKHGAYHWQNYFGSVLKIDSFLRGRYQVVINLLKEAGINQQSKILEVGCGDGALSGLIFKTFRCDITGVEPSSEGVRFSREMFTRYHFKGTFELSEGYSFNFPNAHFDFVVLADVIEHLQHPDLMLSEIKRLLKPAGHAIVTTPVRSSEYPEDKMHVREFYPEELTTLCERYFGTPIKKVYSHPVVWYELYSHGKKLNRSLVRLYCRVMDKVMSTNVFFNSHTNQRWINFKQQGLLLRNRL